MTQSIPSTQTTKKMCRRTIMLSETLLHKIESRAILHGNTLDEEISWSMIAFWGIIDDPDTTPYDTLQPTQQHIMRQVTRMHHRINPSAADLHNYLKHIDTTTIQATLEHLVDLGYLTAIHTAHTTRYSLKK